MNLLASRSAFLAAGSSGSDFVIGLVAFGVWMTACIVLSMAVYMVLSLPQRRLEQARFLLDLLATGLSRGRRPEDTLVELAHTADPAIGSTTQVLAARLESGQTLSDALDRGPSPFPPQVAACLRAGLVLGDLSKVLPACQAMLRDGPSQSRHALQYFILLLTISAPSLCATLVMFRVFIFPKFRAVADDLSEGALALPTTLYLDLAAFLAGILVVLSLVIIVGLLIHLVGPRTWRWIPMFKPRLGDRIAFRLPWKRQRMIRDFTGSLGILLDAGLPEESALTLASACSGNAVFEAKANAGLDKLRRGEGLMAALGDMDATGELAWRVNNASRGRLSFTRALAGWRDSLDARAFQSEQGTAEAVTTTLVLLNGLAVGAVVVSLFGVLVHIVDVANSW